MLKLQIKRKNMQIRTTAAICHYGKNNMANGGNHRGGTGERIAKHENLVQQATPLERQGL